MILGVVADVAECADQRLVHVAVEYQRPASRVQGDLQDAVLALHPHVLVFVAVVVEHRGRAPGCGQSIIATALGAEKAAAGDTTYSARE